MKYISLFSGIGGFDLGFDRAGMECVAQVEKDEKAREVLARHWPAVQKFEDVKDVGRHNLPAAHLICGGSPCQDLSLAGRRAGLAGERSGLWFEFHRIITELRPQWVVFENVPGLFSSHAGRDFAVILAGLTGVVPGIPKGGWRNAGFMRGRSGHYHAAWRVLDAQGFRVAQRRRRVFIVANLTTLGGGCAEVLLERASSTGDPAPRRETGQDIAATVTARTRKGGFTDPVSDNVIIAPELSSALTASGRGFSRAGESRGQDTLVVTGYGETGHGYWQPGIQSLRARGMDDANVIAFDRTQAGQWEDDKTGPLRAGGAATDGVNDSKADQWCVSVSPALSAEGHDSSEDGTNRHALVVCDLQQITSMTNQSQPSAIAPLVTPQQRIVAFTERTRADGRNFEMQEDIAYALTNPGSGGRTHSRQIAGDFGVRRLTPTECARLQGFPDDWNAWLSDSARYRQFGNAVAVPVAEWIGRRIMQVAAGRKPGEDSE